MIPLKKPDIIETLTKEGIELKQRGRDFWAVCPLHSEKTPSFKVNQEKQLWYCFGCNQGGDVITFIEKLHKKTFKESIAYLGIPNGKPYKPNPVEIQKKYLIRKFKDWCNSYYDNCCEFYRLWYQVKMNIKTIEEAEKYSKFYHAEPIIRNYMDILFNGSNEDRFSLFRGACS